MMTSTAGLSCGPFSAFSIFQTMSMPCGIGKKAMNEMHCASEWLKNENSQVECRIDAQDHTHLNNVSKHDMFAICV